MSGSLYEEQERVYRREPLCLFKLKQGLVTISSTDVPHVEPLSVLARSLQPPSAFAPANPLILRRLVAYTPVPCRTGRTNEKLNDQRHTSPSITIIHPRSAFLSPLSWQMQFYVRQLRAVHWRRKTVACQAASSPNPLNAERDRKRGKEWRSFDETREA